MNIRIINTPRGEAPADVRAAWVGLSLPAASGLQTQRCVGVVSETRKGILASLRRLFLGSGMSIERGYLVESRTAVEILEKSNPTAAAWWRESTPHLLAPGRQFLFFEECAVPDGDSKTR